MRDYELMDWDTKIDCYKVRKFNSSLALNKEIDVTIKQALYNSRGIRYRAEENKVYYNTSNLYILWARTGELSEKEAIRMIKERIVSDIEERITHLENEIDKQKAYMDLVEKL